MLIRLEDRMQAPLEDLKDRASRRIWNVAQRWMEWNSDEPYLFPGVGTRAYYRKGDTSALVFDQHPGMRHVVFSADLISERAVENRDFFLNLAFPYMVFVLNFSNGKFVALYVSYLNLPLTSLHQKPLAPNLSNVELSSLKVCMGGDWAINAPSYDFHNQTIQVMERFWGSQFTSNWKEYFEASKNLDERIRTPRKWEASSRIDPSFVLGIPWKDTPYPTYRHLLTRLFEQDTKVQQLNQALFADLVTETVNEIQALLATQREDDPAIQDSLKGELDLFLTQALVAVLPDGDVPSTPILE